MLPVSRLLSVGREVRRGFLNPVFILLRNVQLPMRFQVDAKVSACEKPPRMPTRRSPVEAAGIRNPRTYPPRGIRNPRTYPPRGIRNPRTHSTPEHPNSRTYLIPENYPNLGKNRKLRLTYITYRCNILIVDLYQK